MPRTKRIAKYISSTGVAITTCYCRKCMQMKKPEDFFETTDYFLDSNGRLSICKDCCNDMYEKFMETEGTYERTIMKMCRILNVKFDTNAVAYAKKQIIEKDYKDSFGNYKRFLTTGKSKFATRDQDLTYVEPSYEAKEKINNSVDIVDRKYLEGVWGKGLSKQDYDFLEEEYNRWAGPIGNVTHGEEVLIRDICSLQCRIRKAIAEGNFKLVDTLIESRQKIMKDGALTPALQSAANNGKNVDTFGAWLKDIETMMPAEWYKDKEKFRDMDGVEPDIADIKRGIKNFVTESRDFNSVELEKIDGLEEED